MWNFFLWQNADSFVSHSRYPDVDEKFNGRSYVYSETLGDPGALSSLVKSLFPAATNGNLEMKRLRDKISRHRQGLTYSLRHVVRAFSRHSRRWSWSLATHRAYIIIGFLVCCFAKRNLQIYYLHREIEKRVYNNWSKTRRFQTV